MRRKRCRKLGHAFGIEPFQHARNASPANCGMLRRNGTCDGFLDELMGEGVFEKTAAARLTNDAPIEQLVERVRYLGLVPGAHFANGITRKAIADARRDFGRSARMFGEAVDAACERRFQRARSE